MVWYIVYNKFKNKKKINTNISLKPSTLFIENVILFLKQHRHVVIRNVACALRGRVIIENPLIYLKTLGTMIFCKNFFLSAIYTNCDRILMLI